MLAFANEGMEGVTEVSTTIDTSLAKICSTHQTIIMDTIMDDTQYGDCITVFQGVDCYNQSVTGEVATTVRSTASDADHIPCVVDCYDRNTRARNPESNGDLAPTLLGFAGTGGGNEPFITQTYENHAQDARVRDIGDVSPLIGTTASNPDRGNNPLVVTGVDRYNQSITEDLAPTLKTPRWGDDIQCTIIPKKASSYIVRRLTPLECERLMGYPDFYTMIPFRGKPADQCPDSHRYKACGNGWAINSARWVLQGIDRYLTLTFGEESNA